MISDYTCYYLVGRDDGQHVTKSGSYTLRFDSACALIRLIAEHVPAGPRRDLLMLRPFLITLLPQFGPVFLSNSGEIRAHKLELAQPLMDAYWHEGIARQLKVNERLRLHLVAQGRADPLADVVAFVKANKAPTVCIAPGGGRAYLGYPHFRDRTAGLPDEWFLPTVRETVTIEAFKPMTTDHFRRLRKAARRVLKVRRAA